MKTTEEYINESPVLIKSGVFYESTFPLDQVRITEGIFPAEPGTFLATYATGQAGQVGTAYSFIHSSRLLIQTLAHYYEVRGRVDGTYSLISTVPYDSVAVLNATGGYFHIESDRLLQQTTFKSSSANALLYVFLGSFVVVMFLFVLLVASMPIARVKEHGVKQLLGYSNAAIWFTSIQGLIGAALATAVTLDILLLFVVLTEYELGFVLGLLGAQLLTILLLTAASSTVLFVLLGQKPGDVLKNSVSMKGSLVCAAALKVLLAVALAALSVPVAENALRVVGEYQSQEQWARYGGYSVMSRVQITGEDLDSIASGDTRFEDKFASLYGDINDRLGGIYVSSQDFLKVASKNPLATSYQMLTVNLNYLSAFPVQDAEGEDIVVDETEEAHILLVPVSRRDDIDGLSALYEETVKESIEASRRRVGTTSDIGAKEPAFKVVLYKADGSFFSFNEHVGQDTGFLIKDPLISVITKSNILPPEKWSLSVAGLNSPMKIDLSKPSALTMLADILEEHELTDNALKFDTLENYKAQEISNAQNSLLLLLGGAAVIFGLGVLSSFYLFCVIVLSRRRWLLIARYLGYSQLALFKLEAIAFASLYAAATIGLLVLTGSAAGALVIAIIALLDLFVSLTVARFLDKRSLVPQLKGA
ncbi:MAG: hypothetical protein LBU07_06280 [Coriobacteriales bacterium]|nr:hypothetical protein [Coriobacteriales bacterium]